MRKPCAPGFAGAAALCGLAILAGCGGDARKPTVNVTPTTARVTPGGQQQFFAHVDNAVNPLATFTIQQGGAGGTITPDGLYSVPASATAGTQDILIVTAQDGSAPPARVTIIIEHGVEIVPARAEVSVGRTFQFTAEVNGDNQNRVTWQIKDEPGRAGGTISSSGLYTPPTSTPSAPVTNGSVDTVEAIGVVDPSKRDTAAVTVRSATVPVVVQ